MKHATGWKDNNPDDLSDFDPTPHVIFIAGFIAGLVTVWGFFEMTGF